MDENGGRGAQGPRRAGDRGTAKLLLGGISCVLGIVLAISVAVPALTAPSTGGATVSAGALGIALGVLGYFLGSRRLATVTVLLCTLVLLLGIAASQGLIPGTAPTDRGSPAAKPRS